MTISSRYANNFVPIKYMLSSYRALSDGRAGTMHLESILEDNKLVLSRWKVVWSGTCATLRTAVELFRVDSRSCLNEAIRHELCSEWDQIKKNDQDHKIYWHFLRAERNNIMHEYKWTAYEVWMKPDGTVQSPPSILALALGHDNATISLPMRSGPFEGQDSLELLKEAADWVEARIFAAITRAGYDPDEKRGVFDFREMPSTPISEAGILAQRDKASTR
ncbi:MAG: hypothetical protein AAGH53_09400 [Pseudomonadota bacterium]